uniref:Uncharacterized protein n=1 Tax=Ananas comosus var. bracteatus TaxID=296719 RepID=A0A6V7Q4G1_ANACO|nr:unnamed protein product [Ananas comosus var. bracteatus]
MAHPGKFVSVNLNKSYGQHSSSSSSSTAAGHGRAGRSGQKAAPRLAVPPPLNLPSLKKEHERFDPAASGSAAAHGSSGFGSGSGPSVMGWNKPALRPAPEDKDAIGGGAPLTGRSALDGDRLTGSPYTPPGARSAGPAPPKSPALGFAEKAMILRGEEFPSLLATVASASKQKESAGQKQKQKQASEEASYGRAEKPESQIPLDMRPQMRPSLSSSSNASDGQNSLKGSFFEQQRKKAGLSEQPLPLVKLRHSSDWDDDERDTGLGIPERERDRGLARFEPPLVTDLYDGRGRRGELGSPASNKESREGGSWRSQLGQPRDRFGARDPGVDRERSDTRPFSAGKDMRREDLNGLSPYRDNSRDGFVVGKQDSRYSRGMNTQNGRNVVEAFSGRGAEQSATTHGRYGDNSNNWYKGNSFHGNAHSKGQFSPASKGFSPGDLTTNYGREKRLASNYAKPYVEDVGLDSSDPFSNDIGDLNVKMFKKKKETQKSADFYDPVRESFEAELDNILRMQEQERQRVMEEQARALELARREEEERERLLREEEERRRLLEEEARAAAWQAEQERVEAARRAEEQRIAREEEKRRVFMEEERRKEAARQKLLELEARIARRQAEANARDDRLPSAASKERDMPRVNDVQDWEDGERTVEPIISSAPYDSPGVNRYVSSRDGNSSLVDRGKNSYYSSSALLREQENVYHSPRRDAFDSRRGFAKKEFHSGLATMSARPSSKGGRVESPYNSDDSRYGRTQQRWNMSRDNDNFSKNSDFSPDFLESDIFGDAAFGMGNFHESPRSQPADRLFQNTETDGFSSPAKFRHSLRQPRVLPPPSVSSVHRSNFRNSAERADSSFLEGEAQYANRNEQQILQQPAASVLMEENAISQEQIEKNSPRCEYQSSLSVSSPPSSPTQLSHEEMDVSGDAPALPTSADGERTILSDNENTAIELAASNAARLTTGSTVSSAEDDNWGAGNNEEMEGQDEYDEDDDDDDGYPEIDEAHEGDDENLGLGQQLEDIEEKVGEMEQVILGFDEGVEVKIPGNSELEIAARNSDSACKTPENAFSEETMDISSKILSEAENAIRDLALEPAASSSLEVQAQDMMTPLSSLPLPSTSLLPPPVLSLPSSTVASQSEVPLQLQFGLFSGPSLIPSPVPAIQIGSIQMPIHLHTQVNPSLTQMHPPQAPLFQFGQLRYGPPPISQSVLPLPPQPLPFIKPPVSASYMLNQNPSGSLPNQVTPTTSLRNNLGQTEHSDLSQKNVEFESLKPSPSDQMREPVLSRRQTESFSVGEKMNITGTVVRNEHRGNHGISSKRSFRPVPRESQLPQLVSEEKGMTGLMGPGAVSSGRGKRYGYAPKSSGLRFPFSGAENSQTNSNGFQRRTRRNMRRTEFRIRENVEKKQYHVVESLNHVGQDRSQNISGRARGAFVRNVGKKDGISNKLARIGSEPGNLNSDQSTSRVVGFNGRMDKAIDKPPGGKLNYKISGDFEDIDPPLHSGVVRVFEQPGIEVPSDEDDFIQVRSKKQMINDRREQREKEIKSKLKVPKAPRKQSTISLGNNNPTTNQSKAAVSFVKDASGSVRSDSVAAQGRGSSNLEPSLVFTGNLTSRTLPPIGTPSMSNDTDSRSNDLKSNQAASVPAISCTGEKLVSGILFENNKVASDNALLSLGSQDNLHTNQHVMSLTQTELEEAMKPAHFESHAAPVMSLEPNKSITSTMTQDKPFSSSASPISSLLAGEKIQFGAVTSPTILPTVSRTISSGLGPPGSFRSDLNIDRNVPTTNNDSALFFDKEKHPEESCEALEDAEAEAEAAASAVAVAAITADEIGGSEMGASSAPVSDTKGFSLSSGGVTTGQNLSVQSSGEESLTVALPADLSVDTPSLSFWPPLSSPHSSGPIISQFPGAPPSHFPCFEMNPMIGGRVFTIGPHDESSGPQAQSQISGALPSGPIGAWPQCHSGVDSFYGPPAGFAGPFIGPGGIPGVQGPPHMVVYNHFTPVGQFGQVGLSFMGTTYIPTGKQSDWKHNSVSSAVGGSEGELSNQSGVSSLCTSSSMPAPIQRLGPPPLMPMASPLTMFDIAPFQSSSDISMQARWPHLPPPPLHSVPLSVPLQQHQVDSGIPSNFRQNLPSENPTGNNSKFHEPLSSSLTSSDNNKGFPLPNSTHSHFANVLNLVQQPTSNSATIQTLSPPSGNNNKLPNISKTSARATITANQTGGPSNKPHQQPMSSGQQYLHPVGGTSQKMGTGGEWHRRSGFHGRNQSTGAEKGFSAGRMKQIYVAKTSTSGPANPAS